MKPQRSDSSGRDRLPTIAALVTFPLACLLGVGLLVWLVPEPQQRPPSTGQVRVLPDPPPPRPRPSRPARPTDRPQTAPPTLALPELALPPLTEALELPTVTTPHMANDWRPEQVQLPAGPPTPVTGPPAAGSGDRPADRLVTPDLSTLYPRRAQRRGIEGLTEVVLDIDQQGRVQNVRILSSDPAGVFENAARRAARQLRYRPALVDGQPTAAQVKEVFQWSLR